MAATLVAARPTAVDLALYAGDDFWLDVTVLNPDGSAANLAGKTARADVKEPAGGPVLVSFSASIAGNIIHLALTAAQTALLPGAAAWDCQIADTAIETLCTGQVRTIGQVTI